ncbi:MAG: DUF58 domain-containing protein [Planctomycetes bacterium]|nr:DUF58 domain-containing protein [Planctomycetota bacterium]
MAKKQQKESQGPKYLKPSILQKIEPLDIIARQVVEGARVGMHRSPMHGFSTEFAQHRQYVSGDEIRHIDWRVYARSSKYYVKLFEAETNFTANLLLDASSSMNYGSGEVSKLEYAKYLSASMAYLITDQRDLVGMGLFDSELRSYIQPGGSFRTIFNMSRELENMGTEPRTNVATILHEFARRMRKRGFVMLFSDLFDNVDAFMEGLSHLRFLGHNVIVFHVMDPYELEFPFSGTWKFEGLEEDGELLTQPNRIRASYLEEVKRFLVRIKNECERIHVDYMLVDTSRPVEEIIAAYLIARTYGPSRV